MPAPSAHDIEQVRRRYGARATPAQVAKILGCCVDDVRAIMFPPAPPEPVASSAPPAPAFEWDDRALRLSALMFEMECPAEDVAKAIGCSISEAHRRHREVVAANRAVAA